MTSQEAVTTVLERGGVKLPDKVRKAFVAMAIVGAGAALLGLVVGEPAWTFEALLTATLVVAGLSQVGIIWSCAFQLTSSRWGRSYRRMMELCLVGAPVALAGLLILFVTAGAWVPFADMHFEGGKGVWLSPVFWIIRNFVAIAGLFALSGYYLYHSLRPDLGLAKERGDTFKSKLADRLTRDWKGSEVEIARAEEKRKLLAPILCIAYALIYSMVGFDLVMALDPMWYSTLFGAYHFTGNIYMGLALTVLLAAALKDKIGVPDLFSGKHFGLLGVMIFAFCFLMGDFFWSQFLTIYYGNLPEETDYILQRTMNPHLPYRYLSWFVLAGFFIIPFTTLMFRAVKWVPKRLGAVAVLVIVAMICERFLTTAPPLLQLEEPAGLGEMLVPLGLTIVATIGLLSVVGLLYGWAMERVPLLPVSDPVLAESFKDTEELH